MSRYIVAGNWKMNLGPTEARELAASIRAEVDMTKLDAAGGAVVLCPPYVSLASVVEVVEGSPLQIGAQNCHHEDNGAFTGEITTEMLNECGAQWVIVGHSERRRDQHETNWMIGKKINAAVASGLTPIVCIGESLDERKSGNALTVVKTQLEEIYASCGFEALSAGVIAYEPIWAIGTGEAATPEQAEEVHAYIKNILEDLGLNIEVLYGGSVKASNAAAIFDMPSIDGALVGGASLQATEFCSIVKAANERSQS